MIRTSMAVAVVMALAAPAMAGTISGTITVQAGGGPLDGAEVRVWREGPKGFAIHMTTTANTGGGYSFTVGAGNYLIDARGPAGSGVNYGDRWYDVAAPVSGGYVGENADVLAVTAASATGGVDLALEVLGGSDGNVQRAGAVPATNMWVRMERRGEVRIHHNDFTDPPTGVMSFRGMVPASDYQIMVYDPSGVRDLLLVPGPFTIVSNTNGTLPTVTMNDAPADPNEGNNSPNCGVTSINAAALHMDPPQPWASSGARIGPLANNDVDWFCFTAVDGDRLFFTASTEFTFNAALRKHPWSDPLMAFYRGAGTVRLQEDDDGGGGLDARLDTGPLTAGCHCAAVTAFGDADYNGTGQTSTGPYQLRVVMGNRPPVPSIKKGTTEVPPAPAVFAIDEGDTLDLTLSYVDADHDVPTRSFTHVDSGGSPVAGGTLVLNAGTGTYTWTAPANGAAGSPYTLRLQAADSEFNTSKTVTLVVNAIDMPPPMPVLLAPLDGAVVATGAPPLSWSNAVDPDGDPVTYDLEIYADDVNSAPVQSATAIAEDASGITMFVPATIPENTRVWWRVRARTAAVGGLSPWTMYNRFLIDTANDAPEVPVLVKPAEGETVAMRRPGLSVLNVDDPEDDAVEFLFEVARDSAFTEIEWSSAAVAQNSVSATTMTSTDLDLEWGGVYYARVRARDVRGGLSDWSDSHRFQLKSNLPPGTPAWDSACVATIYTDDAPTSLLVRNVEDPEGETVTFEVTFFRFEDDPLATFPVYMTAAPMESGTTTAVPIDVSGLPNGRYRYFVRAFDGSAASGSIECELTLDLPPPGDAAGGCCGTGSGGADPRAIGGLALVTLAVALRRRRRVVPTARPN